MNRNGKKAGLKISTKKTKVMKINVNNNNAAVIDGQEAAGVDSFNNNNQVRRGRERLQEPPRESFG